MKLKQFLAICTLGVATVATANVSMEMFQMNRQVGVLVNAATVEEFQEGAKEFIEAASKARETLPKSLAKQEDRFEGYQKGMDEVIDTVKVANELAEQGKLDEAKEKVSKLNELKKQYHNEYK